MCLRDLLTGEYDKKLTAKKDAKENRKQKFLEKRRIEALETVIKEKK